MGGVGMKKILVTGANGYIGTVLINKLLKKGYDVTGVDTFFFKNSSSGKQVLNYKFIKRDIRRLKDTDLKKYEVIIHLAALCNDPLGEIRPKATMKINYRATVSLAKMAKKNGVKKFIFASSCSVYGITSGKMRNEKSKIYPTTTYAKSKALSEKELRKLADDDFCVIILRNSTVYGYSPQLRNDILVNNLVTQALALGKIKMLSDGTPWRSMVDIRDLVAIYIGFLETKTEKVNGEIFNIGFNENNFRVKSILNEVAKKFPRCLIEIQSKKGNQGLSYRVDSRKFQKILPQIKQKWPLSRSVNNLITMLKKDGFTTDDFHLGKFNRLSTLNSLLEKGLLNDNLFWKKNDKN